MALQVRDDIRLAGRVKRWHTWPHIREQTVAEHSWQLLRILLAIWPDAPRPLLVHAVTHDIGEVTVGDPPYPIKANNPLLKSEMDRLEHDAAMELCSQWGLPMPQEWAGEEKWAFKLAEFLEMWEWGWEEELMGNRFASLVKQRCLRVAEEVYIREALSMESRFSDLTKMIARNARTYISIRRHLWGDA